MSQKLELNGKYLSKCHNMPTLLVQSRSSGFVTQDCTYLGCGHSYIIGISELPTLFCSTCHEEIYPSQDKPSKPYYYECASCGQRWPLHTLIPYWDEKFPYHGLGLPGDNKLALK